MMGKALGIRLEAGGWRREVGIAATRRTCAPPAHLLQPQACFLKPQASSLKPRSGITLLEVLISMFVLLVGLLGVASLLPVGKFEAQRGAKYDRAAACGRAALREVKTRGMLNPDSWAQADTNGTAVHSLVSGVSQFDMNDSSAGPANFRAFAIDPLGVGNPSGTNSLGVWFPYSDTPTTLPTVPLMPRITLGPGTAITATARAALADAVFRCQDDLVFNTPTDETLLPAQILQGGARRLSQGDFSWLVTVVPDAVKVAALISNNQPMTELPMRVSVAVFYKRNLLPPTNSSNAAEGERICKIQALSGFGEITITTAGVTALTEVPADHLKVVKPGEWLMIAGPVNGVWDYRWYRIVSASDIEGTGPWTRYLTIAGPDWNISTTDMPTFINDARVFLFEGIVNVYEKMLKLETVSMY